MHYLHNASVLLAELRSAFDVEDSDAEDVVALSAVFGYNLHFDFFHGFVMSELKLTLHWLEIFSWLCRGTISFDLFCLVLALHYLLVNFALTPSDP